MVCVMGHLQTRKNTNKQEKTPTNKKNTNKQEKHQQTRKTPPNKKKHLQTRKNTNKQEKHLSSKGYLPIKCKSLQVVGISGQGKAVVSDGG